MDVVVDVVVVAVAAAYFLFFVAAELFQAQKTIASLWVNLENAKLVVNQCIWRPLSRPCPLTSRSA